MNGMIRLSPTVKIFLVIYLVAFVVQQSVDQFMGGHLMAYFGLVPAGFILQHRAWQLFTYPFLHADVMHLFLNGLLLAFIGSEIEFVWGRRKWIIFYFFCSTFAGVAYLFLQAWVYGGDGIYAPMVGASGALYGLLLAYGVLFGERVMLFMMLFPMKAKHFVWILAGVEFMTTVFSGRAGLASSAHLGGMFAGLAYLYGERQLRRGLQLPKFSKGAKRGASKKSHLKLVVDKNDRDGGPKTWH